MSRAEFTELDAWMKDRMSGKLRPFKIDPEGSKWAIWKDTGDSWTRVTGSFGSYKEAADMVRSWLGKTGKKKNPAPYKKFGAASKKLRKSTKQDDDWGDPAAFASTYPDEREERTTRTYLPGQTRPNPASFTKKGERLYEHIKEGYGHDPRAKEIAARTVYKISHSTPGLVKKSPKRNPYGSFARGGSPVRRSKPTATKYSLWLKEQSKGQLNKLEKALTVLVDNNPGAVQGLQQKLTEVRRELSRR